MGRRLGLTVTRTADQERISRLESDLWMARHTIVDLMPEDAREILMGQIGIKDHGELYRWAEGAAEKLIDLAKEIQPARSWEAARAFCPLCGDGTSSPYERGFAIPEGLRRHLLGTYNSTQCRVVQAAVEMARHSIDRREREWSPRLG